MDRVLLETLEDGVLTLTMNRPDRLNALNAEMLQGLLDAVTRAAADPAVGVMVLDRRRPRLLRRRRRQGDGRARRPQREFRRARRGICAGAWRCARLLHEIAEADHRHAARPRRRRRIVAGARLRPAHRRRDAAPHHRLRQGGALRRFRRQLFPVPPRRPGQGARALFHFAGAGRRGGAGAGPRQPRRRRCRARGGDARARAVARPRPPRHAGLHEAEHEPRRAARGLPR